MPVTGLDHYNLRGPAALIAVLRRFYVEVIGLEPGPRPAFRSRGYWLYAQGKDVLHLTEASVTEVREATARNSFDHVAFACSDLSAIQAQLQLHGVEYQIATVPDSTQIQLFLRDPAGNGIELNFACGAQLPKPEGASGT